MEAEWWLLAAYLLVCAAEYGLTFINLRHLRAHGHSVPPEFEGAIDVALLARSSHYLVDKTRLALWSTTLGQIVLLVFLFGGWLKAYDQFLAGLRLPFILSGVVFFLALSLAQRILQVPFDAVQTFRIENQYGFNTMTPALWLADLGKSLLLSVILLGILISAGLRLLQAAPAFWWFWIWAFFLVFSLLVMYVSPYVLEPLFNKFTPLEEDAFLEDIRGLMAKAGIRVSRIFKMDASKRSRHTNAYFTGIGKVKRIVLFDTLLEKMNHAEILAVLAHEAGHWKKKHLLKRLVISEAAALAAIYLAFRLLQTDWLAGLFQLQPGSLFAKLVVLGFIFGIASFPLTPLANYFSRRHEREADRFSRDLTGDPASLASALIKLSKDNLSNLHPHPWYAAFYYSHPPVVERIRRLKAPAS